MLILLSPAKTLDEVTPVRWKTHTQPALLSQAEILARLLRKMSAAEISSLMDVSDKIAALNAARFQQFHTPFAPENARPALAMFKGDVYEALRGWEFSEKDVAFAQTHLRILSGLYGLLKPLDLMQPYRLEMGTNLAVGKAKNLYDFWREPLAAALNAEVKNEGSGILLNLASEEYFKAVDARVVKADIITVQFKERRGNKLQTIGLLAKRARGAFARFVVENRIEKPAGLKDFRGNGYRFEQELSGATTLTFVGKAA